MLARLICRLLRHQPPAGVVRAWSMRFECRRCGQVVPGGLWVRR